MTWCSKQCNRHKLKQIGEFTFKTADGRHIMLFQCPRCNRVLSLEVTGADGELCKEDVSELPEIEEKET